MRAPRPAGDAIGAKPERSSSKRIRVLVIHPQRSFADALTMRLEEEQGIHVVAGVVRPGEATPVLQQHHVDVVLLGLGGADQPLRAMAALRARRPEAGFVALAEHEDVDLLAQAVRLGVRGWVPVDAGVTDLLAVIHGVHRGETRIPPLLLTRLLPMLLAEQDRRRAAGLALASLTARERQVLRAISRGATRDDIAAQLRISPNTVRTHTQNILSKLGVHSALAAASLARRNGLD